MPRSQRSLLRVALHGAGLQQRCAGLPGAEFWPETRGSRELLGYVSPGMLLGALSLRFCVLKPSGLAHNWLRESSHVYIVVCTAGRKY